jgi:tRNA (guanine37-N1)-methyltransferase
MIHFDLFSLFPGMFSGFLADSILKRAQSAGVMSVSLHNIRDYAEGRHRVTDDKPYGGGGGMVMKPEPIFRAVETVLTHEPGWSFVPSAEAPEPPATAGPVDLPEDVPIILLSPQGRTFSQTVAEELAHRRRIALICGRYEGVDERVREGLVTDEISIGDFVISGGELGAAIIVDAVTRLQPGALGCEMGAFEDSFATGVLEYPQYTKPPAFRGTNRARDSEFGRSRQGGPVAPRTSAAAHLAAPPGLAELRAALRSGPEVPRTTEGGAE